MCGAYNKVLICRVRILDKTAFTHILISLVKTGDKLTISLTNNWYVDVSGHSSSSQIEPPFLQGPLGCSGLPALLNPVQPSATPQPFHGAHHQRSAKKLTQYCFKLVKQHLLKNFTEAQCSAFKHSSY